MQTDPSLPISSEHWPRDGVWLPMAFPTSGTLTLHASSKGLASFPAQLFCLQPGSYPYQLLSCSGKSTPGGRVPEATVGKLIFTAMDLVSVLGRIRASPGRCLFFSQWGRKEQCPGPLVTLPAGLCQAAVFSYYSALRLGPKPESGQ